MNVRRQNKDMIISGFPGGSDSKESTCSAGDQGSIPALEKVSWKREWLPNLVFLPGEFQGPRSLAVYSPQGCKELDTTSNLAWKHWSGSRTFESLETGLSIHLLYDPGQVISPLWASEDSHLWKEGSNMGWSVVKNSPIKAGDAWDPSSDPWVRKIPWRRKW